MRRSSYLARAPFGLALQGVRDNPRRMAALGFNVNAHRIAAYVVRRASSPRSAASCWSGATADLAGLGQRRPRHQHSRHRRRRRHRATDRAVHRRADLRAAAALSRSISCVAVGLDGNRFRLLIGLGFLVIVFWSPDGVIGLWERWRDAARRRDGRPGGGGHG